MRKTLCLLLMTWLLVTTALSAPRLSQPHGVYEQPFTLTITPEESGADIYYTTDGSLPTARSKRYTAPLTLSKTTVLRAVEVTGGEVSSDVSTATYIFVQSVLHQQNSQPGYPDRWGSYVQIKGTAKADYEMDPEIVDRHADDIAASLTQLPILSFVGDPDSFFGLENDPDRGGIYIYTGAPVGSGVGRGWERHVSVELFDARQHDLTTSCAVTLHGGHGRLPEKNPKHSFRLKFKSDYGPAKLNYPLFGSSGAQSFNSLVVRTFFGNSWQHWKNDSRTRGQYTRDLWARQMQRWLGHPFADGIYVHLFINGLYWGLYNIAERIDDSYCKEHFGGSASDYDVIKVEELSGKQVVTATDGTMDKWDEMVAVARLAADDSYYCRLQGQDANGIPDPALEPLLDIDGFIDYMLINQYGGNTDWDIHNWYAFRNRTTADKGFQFICWDTESIFEDVNDNRINLNNKGCPSEIFLCLMRNRRFQNRYMNRAHQLLTGDGLLTSQKVVQLWDSLYNTIASSLYAESARWGDYRRDVHPYSSRGDLYTVEGAFTTERQRLLNDYFPWRSEVFLSQLANAGWYSTGIADLATGQAPSQRVYDLSGRRRKATRSPGLFIQNGKLFRPDKE